MASQKLITLQVLPEDLQLIFQALGARPYREVFLLIEKLNQQATPQLKPAAALPDQAP